MASVPLEDMAVPQAGTLLVAAIRDHGSFGHRYAHGGELLEGPSAGRNLADAIHFLCALHGRYPGVIELVAARNVESEARAWLAEASDSFARERTYLANLAVRAGPVPATPGAGSESAISMQRNAVLTLAQSERRGCALGAAMGVAGDWAAIRKLLDAAAAKFGADIPPPWTAGKPEAMASVADALGDTFSFRRAMLFGAEQVAVQHRGMWDLLHARAQARD